MAFEIKHPVRFRLFGAANIIWLALVVFASAAPPIVQEGTGLLSFLKVLPFYDKLVHLTLYGVQCFLLCGLFAQTSNRSRGWEWPLIIAICVGALMELLQYTVFIGRSADVFDLIANSIGALLGAIAWKVLFFIRSLYFSIRRK